MDTRRTTYFWAFLIFLSFLNLWLISSFEPTIYSNAVHDDAYYMSGAINVLNGKWLGSYHVYTLIKNPTYHFFLALSHLSGFSVVVSSQFLYLSAVWVTIVAVKPMVRQYWVLLVVFVLLSFMPVSALFFRVYRTGIFHSLALGAVATAIGLFIRTPSPLRHRIVWGGLLGIFYSAFFLLREETYWMTIVVVFLALASVVYVLLQSNRTPYRVLSVVIGWMLAIIILVGLIGAISALNQYYYGLFGTSELTHPTFVNFVKAVHHVREDDEYILYVETTRSELEKIYAVSPAFAELEPVLDGFVGDAWQLNGADNFHISNGYLLWALRDAVKEAGYYQSGRFPAEYYERATAEILSACDSGQLHCEGHPLSGIYGFTVPPDGLAHFIASFARLVDFTTSLQGTYHTNQSNTDTNHPNYYTFVDLTNTYGHPLRSADGERLPLHKSLYDTKNHIWEIVHQLYSRITPILFGMAITGYIWLTAQLITKREQVTEWMILTAIGGGLLGHAVIITLSTIGILHTITLLYNAPAYSLLYLFIAMSIYFAGRHIYGVWSADDASQMSRLVGFQHRAGTQTLVTFLGMYVVVACLALGAIAVRSGMPDSLSVYPFARYTNLTGKFLNTEQFQSSQAEKICLTIADDTRCGLSQDLTSTFLKLPITVQSDDATFNIAMGGLDDNPTITYEIAICDAFVVECMDNDEKFETLQSTDIHEVGWVNTTTPLGEWANQTITIGLRASTTDPPSEDTRAIWGTPHTIMTH